MQLNLRQTLNENRTWLALLFIIIAGFFVYVYSYQNPAALFWDENYHIASAQKYINHVYFMEPHPPLGKLLIALGEKIVHPNLQNNQFIGTDYATNPPPGFSFAGYRLFPVLLAWWTAPLLFLIFLILTRRVVWALLFDFLYLFDNALVVHARSAMLESTMLFFASLTILSFLLLMEWKESKKGFMWMSLLFGMAFACLMTTKAFGLILILLLPFLAWNVVPHVQDRKNLFLTFGGITAVILGHRVFTKMLSASYDKSGNANVLHLMQFLQHPLVYILGIAVMLFFLYRLWHRSHGSRIFLRFFGFACLSFAIFFCGIWQIHFSLGSNVNPSLPDNGYYQASPQYKQILINHTNGSWLNFPVMLRDSLAFVTHYERGVPRLNLCKADENGSPWFLWPVGSRAISYRWETPDGNSYKYLYLQSNPVIWLTSFAGVLLAFMILLSSVLVPVTHRPKNTFLLLTFSTLYLCFMIAVSRIDRVMYLYHYFLPLFFSFFLLALVFDEIQHVGKWHLNEQKKTVILLVFCVLAFFSYQFYRPFSSYQLITDDAFKLRSIFKIWDLKCVHCQSENPLVIPVSKA